MIRSKPSKELVTGLRRSVEGRARGLRVVVFHLITVSAVLGFFSLIIYLNFSNNVDLALINTVKTDADRVAVGQQLNNQFGELLIFVDMLFLGVIVVVGFFLLNRILMPVREAILSQKHFVADVSHQLRTPITILKTDLEVTMLENRSDCKVYKLAESNLEEVNKIQRIVEELLLLSRIDRGKVVLSFSRYNLGDLVCGVVQKLQSYAKIKGQKLICEIKNVNIYISADKVKLVEAISNIIENAVDYSKAGGRVRVSVEEAHGRGFVRVADEGIGIADEDLPKIFQRYFRAEHTKSQKGDGNGIGLSIAQWIIKRHGGSIIVKSKLGKGTQVYMNLPVLKISS